MCTSLRGVCRFRFSLHPLLRTVRGTSAQATSSTQTVEAETDAVETEDDWHGSLVSVSVSYHKVMKSDSSAFLNHILLMPVKSKKKLSGK